MKLLTRSRFATGSLSLPSPRCIVVNSTVLLIGIALHAAPAQAQSRGCDECLAVRPVASLSSSSAPIVPSLNQSVAYAGGHFFVSHRFASPPQIAAYDTTGRFIRLYDREGDGPGEFKMAPDLFAGSKNTIWAFDQNRLVRLDAGLRHIATHALAGRPYVSNMVVLRDGRAVLASKSSLTEGGTVLNVIDTTGAMGRVLDRSPDRLAVTVVAPASNGGYWTLMTNQLLLRLYSSTGDLSRSVQLAMDFQPWQGMADREGHEGYDFPPRPIHTGVLDVGSDQLVVLTRVAGKEWAPRPTNQSFRPSELDSNVLYDTVVTLVDARAGQTIAAKRLAEDVRLVNGSSNLASSKHSDDVGNVVTTIVRIDTQARARL